MSDLCPCCGGTGFDTKPDETALRETLIAAGVTITEDDRVMLKAVATALGIPYGTLRNRRRGCGGQRGRYVPIAEVATLLDPKS